MKHHSATALVVLSVLLILAACTPVSAIPTSPPTVARDKFKYSVAQEGFTTQLTGTPYDIVVDNCSGARDSTKTEERSQTYLVELSIEVSNKIAAELGADIKLAEVMLRDEIGLALGVRIGSQAQAKSAIEIVTPPGAKTVTTIQWKESWVRGNIAIQRPDGSYIGVVPFQVLNALTLDQQGSRSVNCETGAAVPVKETPKVQPTPVSIPKIVPTLAPVSLGTLSVPGNSSEGVRFPVNQAGLYTFKYVRGAYSVYPVGSIPAGEATWLTAVRVFKNRPIVWEGTAISNFPDYNAADAPYSFNASEAEAKVRGQTTPISLLQGDYLILAAVDGRPYYSDNPGEVIFEVFYTPPQ